MKLLVESFPSQWREAVKIASGFRLKHRSSSIRNFMVGGVGGSAMGGDLLKELFGLDPKGPIFVNRTYRLPDWVDRSTLFCAVSYSGSTEETLALYQDAQKRKVPTMAVTSGGRLLKAAQRDCVPVIRIPSGYPPRAALAYTFLPQLRVASLLGWSGWPWREAVGLADRLEKRVPYFSDEMKQVAGRLGCRPALIVTSEEGAGCGVRWKGQINENAKGRAYHVLLPEMHHNEVVGWYGSRAEVKRWLLICLRHPTDHPRVRLRFDLTRQLWKRRGGEVVEVRSEGTGPLERMMSLVSRADWLSLWLAERNGVDATAIPPIVWIKRELQRR